MIHGALWGWGGQPLVTTEPRQRGAPGSGEPSSNWVPRCRGRGRRAVLIGLTDGRSAATCTYRGQLIHSATVGHDICLPGPPGAHTAQGMDEKDGSVTLPEEEAQRGLLAELREQRGMRSLRSTHSPLAEGESSLNWPEMPTMLAFSWVSQ